MTDQEDKPTHSAESVAKSFEPLVGMIAAPVDGRSPLWLAWHQLQVYATWSERLPVEESDFKALMGASPVGYSFFPPLQEGNKMIAKASSEFLRSTYDEIVNVSNDLLSFAENVSPNHNKILLTVKELLEAGAASDAVTLLTDLQDMAKANAETAGTLQKKLSGYKDVLSQAIGKFDIAKTSLEKDSKTNKAELDKLMGDEKVEGSLAYLEKKIKDFRAEYDHYVIVASTTPTYAWVWPFGPIAATIVAGIYGDKAVKKLKELEEAIDKAAKAHVAANAAYQARTIYDVSSEGRKNAQTFTSLAISNLGIVQTAWGDVVKHLGEILKWAKATTSDNADGGRDPKSMALVSIYLGRVGEEWGKMVPMLKDLSTDLYVQVEPGKTTLSEMSEKIRKQLAA